MAESNKTVVQGPGAVTLLGVAFVILKLTGVINWSWWWVTAPFWGTTALVFAIAAIIGVGYIIAKAVRP